MDGISPKLLKETVEQISTPLANEFNMSLQEGIVPLEWKEANIIHLFKNDSRNKSVNYRPVSLTSVICKLLETIIRDHMMDFLIKHKLINPSQHGFLKARSCLTNLLCLFEEITKWADDGSPVDIMYLDFQKSSTYKFKRDFFRHDRRTAPKFGTHVWIETRLALTKKN